MDAVETSMAKSEAAVCVNLIATEGDLKVRQGNEEGQLAARGFRAAWVGGPDDLPKHHRWYSEKAVTGATLTQVFIRVTSFVE